MTTRRSFLAKAVAAVAGFFGLASAAPASTSQTRYFWLVRNMCGVLIYKQEIPASWITLHSSAGERYYKVQHPDLAFFCKIKLEDIEKVICVAK